MTTCNTEVSYEEVFKDKLISETYDEAKIRLQKHKKLVCALDEWAECKKDIVCNTKMYIKDHPYEIIFMVLGVLIPIICIRFLIKNK